MVILYDIRMNAYHFFCSLSALISIPAALDAEVPVSAAVSAALAQEQAGAQMVVPDAHGLGYVLVAPRHSSEVVLLDGKGQEAHVWASNCKGTGGARVLPDGSLLRLARAPLPPPFNQFGIEGGRLQHISWDGRILWDFLDATSEHMAYGDLLKLPNGNILVSVLEFHSRQECEARGREPGLITDKGLLVPALIEFTPKGKSGGIQVWRWSLWDHLYQGRNPNLPEYHFPGQMTGRLDLGTRPSDKGPVWVMPMEIDYHPREDLISLVMGGLGEVWLVDHSTSTAEASSREGGRRGRGGDLLLRWQGPALLPEAEQRSAIISAEWSEHQADAADIRLTVLRMGGPSFSALVEEVALDREKLDVTRVTERHRVAPDTVKEAGGSPFGRQPTAASRDAGTGAIILTYGNLGAVQQVEASLPSWKHENARGKITMRLREDKGGEECCGNEKPSKQAVSTEGAAQESKPVQFQAAPITKARLYKPGSFRQQR